MSMDWSPIDIGSPARRISWKFRARAAKINPDHNTVPSESWPVFIRNAGQPLVFSTSQGDHVVRRQPRMLARPSDHPGTRVAVKRASRARGKGIVPIRLWLDKPLSPVVEITGTCECLLGVCKCKPGFVSTWFPS